MNAMGQVPIIPYAQPPPPSQGRPPGHDGGLLFGFGVFLIILGCMVGATGGFAGLLLVLDSRPTSPRELLGEAPAFLLWAVVVTGLIWTGIGSIRLRRWARAVVLSASGVSVSLSAVTLLVMAFLHATMPPVATPLQRRGRGRAGAGARAVAASATDDWNTPLLAGLILVFGLVLPLVVFLAYRSRRVAQAVEEADTRRSWADGRPTCTIALSLASALASAAVFTALFNMPPIPVGAASAEAAEARVILGGAMIALAVCFAWAAWLIFRLHPLAPWVALLLIGLAAGGSTAAMASEALRSSFGGAGAAAYAQYEVTWLLQLASIRGLVAVGLYAVPAAVYVLYVRRVILRMAIPTTARPT